MVYNKTCLSTNQCDSLLIYLHRFSLIVAKFKCAFTDFEILSISNMETLSLISGVEVLSGYIYKWRGINFRTATSPGLEAITSLVTVPSVEIVSFVVPGWKLCPVYMYTVQKL